MTNYEELSLQYILFLNWIKEDRFEPNPVKILDIGPADVNIEKFLPKNMTIDTLDIGPENNPGLNPSNTYTYIHDLDKMPTKIKDNSYDVVICFETLEHVMYPRKVLKEIKRIAKNNAIIYLSLPNEYNFIQRAYHLFGIKTFCDEPFEIVEKHLHIHKPRFKDIANLFSSEFKIIKTKPIWQTTKLPRVVDRLINIFLIVNPSLFSRALTVKAMNIKK